MNNPERDSVKKECLICKREFVTDPYRGKKYCSQVCRLIKFKRLTPSDSKVNTGTVGAISELKVSADLMSKGYCIFRALSPMSSCDLLALKNKKTYRVEVTTGYYSNGGTLYFDRHKKDNFDIIAVVHSTGIVYKPSLIE